MTKPSPPESGFTLVEMLVALALLSIMTLYAWQSLSMLQKFKLIADRAGSQMEVDAAAKQMQLSISDTRGIFAHDINNQLIASFEGQPHHIQFIASSDGQRETGGLYVVTYAVDDKGDLVSTHRLFRENETLAETRIVLLRGIKQISFRYFDKVAIQELVKPSDTWSSKFTLPIAIEINLEFAQDEKRKWPPTFITIPTGFLPAEPP